MKLLLILATAICLSACVPDNYPVTYPAGSQLCRSDYDCMGGEYCGFTPGYTAAVCRGGGAYDSWVGSRTGFKLNPR